MSHHTLAVVILAVTATQIAAVLIEQPPRIEFRRYVCRWIGMANGILTLWLVIAVL